MRNPSTLWENWQELGDSNPRPSVLETDALPTELNSCAFGGVTAGLTGNQGGFPGCTAANRKSRDFQARHQGGGGSVSIGRKQLISPETSCVTLVMVVAMTLPSLSRVNWVSIVGAGGIRINSTV
jgi:hypothetical protein